MLKIFNKLKCKFFDHKLEKAGSCPYTGKNYNYCVICEKIFEI